MPEISIKAEQIFSIGFFTVTNAYLLSLITLGVLVSGALVLKSRLALVPGKIQGFLELLFEEVLKLMDSVLGERALSLKYFPVVTTVFLFIWISNWLGLLPGVGSVLISHEASTVPLFRAPAADLNFTIALASIVMIGVQFFGTTALGFKKYFSKFFTLKNPILSFAGLLEFISEFVKIISFSFRLFGNIFAGEVLLTIVGFLAPYFVPLPFLFMEFFVGFIQAFIFAMLSIVFIAMAVTGHESEH